MATFRSSTLRHGIDDDARSPTCNELGLDRSRLARTGFAAPDPAGRDILRDRAAQVGATFVDPIAQRWIVDTPQLIEADGVHPTDDGHKYLAQKITPLIQNALGS